MISILATTAFFTAVMADSNPTWGLLFALHPETLDSPKTELAALGGEESCYELTEKGTGYNLELAKHCKEVTDYELQCAGEDLEGLVTATEGEAEAEVATETVAEEESARRLDGTEAAASSEVETTEEGAEGESVPTPSPEEKAALEAEKAALEAEWATDRAEYYDANIKQFGALVACIQRNRYYSSSPWNTSWLKEKYSTLTCPEVLEKYGGGSCDDDDAKKYAINVCCPKTCATSEKLDCVVEEHEKIIEENKIGDKKEGEDCEGHSDCAANLQCGSEARPTLSTTTTVAPAEENAEEVPAENTEESAENTEVVAPAERRLEGTEDATVEDAAPVEDATVEDAAGETVTEDAAPATETEEAVVAAQKKCQKAGASYYGFAFIAALLAVVSL